MHILIKAFQKKIFRGAVMVLGLFFAGGNLSAEVCTVRLGEDGGTRTFTYDLTGGVGQYVYWTNQPGQSFIRSTSGPCNFFIYNGSNLDGKWVAIGTDLGERIRPGLDGIENKSNGGGDTWKARSVLIQKADTTCRLRVGGNGVRMTYYPSSDLEFVPRSNRVESLMVDGATECEARVHNSVQFGIDDYDNRYKTMQAANGIARNYDPGFFVRSVSLFRKYSSGCAERDFYSNRCVPQTTTFQNLYTNNTNLDKDGDGLHDFYENVIAQTFRPVYNNHSTEDSSIGTLYYEAGTGAAVSEPATIFQVRQTGTANEIAVQYNSLWYNDSGCALGGAHQGDFGMNTIFLRTSDGGRHWYAVRTSMHDDESAWTKDAGQLRATTFAYWGEGTSNHATFFFMKGKHHNYSDTGWSGQQDIKTSGLGLGCTCYNNGRGYLVGLPTRAASLYLPAANGLLVPVAPNPGAGTTPIDGKPMTNAGSAGIWFFNDLTIFTGTYAGQRIYDDPNFFSSDSAGRGFQ
jgi:hypothetical protein